MINPLARQINIKSILSFTLPTICMMMFLSLYTIVDGMFVSAFVSTDALSSLNIAYPMINVIFGVALMFASGGSAIVAKKLGEKNDNEARENLTFIYVMGFIIGIVFAVFVNVFIEPILYILGANELLYKDAYIYLTIMATFAPLCILQVLTNFFIVTAGKPAFGLLTTVFAGLTNMIFDYVFIVIFDFGIAGAALATVMGYSIPSLFGVLYFLINKKGLLYFVSFKSDFKMLLQASVNGSSEMVTNLAAAVTIFLFNIKMMELAGSDGIAAITIILYAQFLFNAAFLGFSSGISPIYGFNYGEKNFNNLKKLFRLSLSFIGICSIFVFGGSICLLPIVNMLFAGSNLNVLDIANGGVFIFSLSFLTMGFNIFISSMFTALSNGRVSAILSFLRTFLFISLFIIFLPSYFGIVGIWLAIPFAELIALFVTIYFVINNRKVYEYY